MKDTIILFRNDDIRGTLDDSLIELTDIFIERKIPLTHAVEPANVSDKVVNWLIDIKKTNPDLIEIVQHGYNHQLNYTNVVGGKLKKGEFGGNRNFNSQFLDIQAGKDLMDKYFGEFWFPSFTFPFGARNEETIKAIKKAGFLVVNGGIDIGWKHMIFYWVGRLLKRELLFNRKVSYNLKIKPNSNLFQIDFAISIIKKYINEETCIFRDIGDLKELTNRFLKMPNIGVLLHHRFHNSPESMQLVRDFLDWLKTFPNLNFSTQQQIYMDYVP
jgi:hypothetical protein